MKPTHRNFTCLLLAFLFLITSSITGVSQTRCHTDEYTQERLENDPQYRKWLKDLQEKLHKKVDYSKSVSCTNPLIIPVAVHYNGNVTDANETCLIDKALEQVDVLNEDFGGYNSDITDYCDLSEVCCDEYPADAISQGTCLQFCLASLDHPAGETVIGGYAITVGDHSWPSTNEWEGYLNFFVTDGIGFLGQAPLDGGADPDGNGVQVLAAAFGGVNGGCTSGTGIDTDATYNLGRTGTHEVGHYFGLEHVFNGCSSASGPDGNTNNGDGIDDTPEQSNQNFGCPDTDTGDCSSDSEDCGTADFYFNYMDYVDDECMYMFTEDQGQHMYNVAGMAGTGGNEAYKSDATVCDDADIPTYDPTYPSGCPSSTLPDSDFTPAAGTFDFCPGMDEIEFIDASTGCSITGWDWTFSGAGVSPTSSTIQNPTVTVSSSGTLTVTLEASNASGVDPSPASKNYTINVFGAGDDACLDCDETFTDSGGTGDEYENNEDLEWTFCAAPGDVVEVVFTLWDVEDETTCNWDAMEVHDGDSTSDPSMGIFCGNGLSDAPGGGTITSTDECITFHFTSDFSITEEGWEATVNCIQASVPVNWIEFNALAGANEISLEWATASEIHNKGFQIQRSADAIHFENIGFIEGNGNSYSRNDYEFIDLDVRDNVQYYYRLEQQDLDGRIEYSSIRSAILNNGRATKFIVAPNPNNGVFSLQNVANHLETVDLEITLVDKSGKLVKRLKPSVTSREVIELNITDVASGVYHLMITTNNAVEIHRVVLIK